MKEFEYDYKIMGTEASVSIITKDKSLADKLAKKSYEEMVEYENKFSRFKKESELSIVNLKKEMIVSNIFMEVILEAKKLFIKTEGYFNPLVQIDLFGYSKDFKEIIDLHSKMDIKTEEEINRGCDINFNDIFIDENISKVVLKNNHKLDFGGFLKGFLAEKIARKIKSSEGVSGVIVNIGGDLFTMGLDSFGKEFIFDIYNPVKKEDGISIKLYNKALATSGTYKRNWKLSGKFFHHILNKNGQENPETDIVSVSVIHENGGCADAYTKIFLSAGPEKAIDILKEKLGFIIIKNDGQIIKN